MTRARPLALIDGAELRSYFRLVVEGDQRYFHSKSCHWIGQYRVAKCFDRCVEYAVFPHGAGHVHHQRDGAAALVVVDEVSRRLEGDVIIVVVVVGPEEFSLGIGPGSFQFTSW